MKKIIFGIVFFLLMPIFVSADMGAPAITEYKARISNNSGAEVIDWDGEVLKTLAYDTVVTIKGEYYINNETYASVELPDVYGYIKLSSIQQMNEEIDYSKFSKEEVHNKLYVFEKGVYLYKGASKIYGKVSEEEIPVGTTLEYDYYDEIWAHVKYQEKEGWVYMYTSKDLSPYQEAAKVASVASSDAKVMTFKQIELKSSPLNGKNTGSFIPANVELHYLYSYFIPKYATYLYVEYEGKKGWIEHYDAVASEKIVSALGQECTSIYLTEETPIYKERDINSMIVTNVKKDTELDVIYRTSSRITTEDGLDYENWYYVEANNQKGWVLDDVGVGIYWGYGQQHRVLKEIPLSQNYGEDSSYDTLKVGETFFIKYRIYLDDFYFYYVVNDRISGWIGNELFENSTESIDTIYRDTCFVKKVVTDEDEKQENNNEENVTLHNKNLSPREIAQICVLVAFVISLVSFIIIKRIHSKSKI